MTDALPEAPILIRQEDFADPSFWLMVASGQAVLRHRVEQRSLRLDFDFHGSRGFVVAQRRVDWILPERFRLHLGMRGRIPANRLEIKLEDESGENVWWYRVPGFTGSPAGHVWVVESRDFEFAWGPQGGGRPHRIGRLEIALVAETGGRGHWWLEELEWENLSAGEHEICTASHEEKGFEIGRMCGGADRTTGWRSSHFGAWLEVDLSEARVLAALSLRWEPGRGAFDFDVLASRDGSIWETVYKARGACAWCQDLYFGRVTARYLRLELHRACGDLGYGLVSLESVPVERAANPHEFFHDLAGRAPEGWYPKYWRRRQSYWTPVGRPAGSTQALMNTEGMVEMDRAACSLEPVVVHEGRVLTWAGAEHVTTLAEGYLPVPGVRRIMEGLRLEVTASAVDAGGVDSLLVGYVLTNTSPESREVSLAVLVRPFQVTPPWQAWREFGGVSPLRTWAWRDGVAWLNESKAIVPLTKPDFVTARTFVQESLFEGLASGSRTAVESLTDETGWATGAMVWQVRLAAGEAKRVELLVPFGTPEEAAISGLRDAWAGKDAGRLAEASLAEWREVLGAVQWQFPADACGFHDTLRTAAAHILINRDGAALQPGPRRYSRSWIRDGALMGAALLRLGEADALRDFLRWYAPWQRADGNVPCCVDREGADWLAEHDSHGQWIYAVMEYYRFTHDRAWLEEMSDTVRRAMDYLMALRSVRTGPECDESDRLARRGLLPESVSHEGYLAQPVHSYWDSFWGIRGMADAAQMMSALGQVELARQYAAEAEALRTAVRESIVMVRKQRGIPYVPGSVEWADFDPSATAGAVGLLGESASFPAEALAGTFEEYLKGWRKRTGKPEDRVKYSAYEIRIIGALARLGKREEAVALASSFLADRRPLAWNQWPEISWPDPESPGHLGDLPHSWIGGEFILAVRSLWAEEEGDRLVLGRGLPEAWLAGEGVSVEGLPTWFGVLGYSVRQAGDGTIDLEISTPLRPPGGIILAFPWKGGPGHVTGHSSLVASQTEQTIALRSAPARITVSPGRAPA